MLHTHKHIQRTLLILTAASTLILAGCGKSAKSMTFQDGYSVLTKNIAAIGLTQPELNTIKQELTTIDIQAASSQGFSASGTILSSGVYASGNALINLAINATAFEPSFNASVLASGAFRVAQLGKTTYGYIDSVALKPISGSADGGIVEALALTMSKKWIDLSELTTQSGSESKGFSASVFNAQAFAYQLTHAIVSSPLFTGTSKTTIDGHPAYVLGWDPEGVSGFVHTLLAGNGQASLSESTINDAIQGILSSPIIGYMITRGSNDVTLRIDSITTTDAGILSAQINTKAPSTWSVIDVDSKETLMTGSATLGRAGFTLTNTWTAAGITLAIHLPSHGSSHLTVTTKDVRISANIHTASTTLKARQTPVITDAVPLSRIQEGFSLLGGEDLSGTATPNSDKPQNTGSEAAISDTP